MNEEVFKVTICDLKDYNDYLRSQFATLKTSEEVMKHSNNEKINFEDRIITPLEKWVDIDLELEQKTVEELQHLAQVSNQSVDNVLTHFLEDFFSEHLELSKLNAESLQQAAEKSPMILILQNGKPIARVKMLEWGDGNKTISSEKTPPRKRNGKKQTQLVTNCDQFVREAASISIFDSEKCNNRNGETSA